DLLGVEPAERGAEALALAQDRQPRQPGLERLQAEPLVEAPVVADGAAPLVVVIGDVVGRGQAPRAAGQPVLAGDRGAHPPVLPHACDSAARRRSPRVMNAFTTGPATIQPARPRGPSGRSTRSAQRMRLPAPSGTTSKYASPRTTRPVCRTATRRPSRHSVITIVSTNPTGPTPVRPRISSPTLSPPSARVNGIHSGCRGQSVRTAKTRSAGAPAPAAACTPAGLTGGPPPPGRPVRPQRGRLRGPQGARRRRPGRRRAPRAAGTPSRSHRSPPARAGRLPGPRPAPPRRGAGPGAASRAWPRARRARTARRRGGTGPRR